MKLSHLLVLPEMREFGAEDYDHPSATMRQRRIYYRKPFLQHMYRLYLRPFVLSARRLPQKGRMLEVGAGIGQMKEQVPGLISSDLIPLPWLDLVCSAYKLPFPDGSLDRIFGLFVLHHMGQARRFLDEAYRCLRPGGELVLVEPAVTTFSRLYFRYLHPDGIDTDAPQWGFSQGGRISGANSALPWIVFFRDREAFRRRYPYWKVVDVEYNTCLAYLASGGFRLRPLLPLCLLKALFAAENWIISHVTRQLAVTMALTIRREHG